MSDHRSYKLRDFHSAQLLIALRRKAHLTQKEVALRIGVSEKAIRNWESGSNYPSDVHLRNLIECYVCTNAFVAGYEQDEVRQFWDQLHERSPSRIGSFDERWFLSLLKNWQEPSLFPLRPSDRLVQGDGSEALDISSWYGRTEELAELEPWLLGDRCRLVAVLGMGGIGKTTLAVKLVRQVASHFACVLWRSLSHAPSLQGVLHDWLPILSEQRGSDPPQNTEQALSLFIRFLQERRCLLVLDNLETLFQSGGYRPGYEDYATLIRAVAQTHHQSCLLLTSRELFQDEGVFFSSHTPVRAFRLAGLDLAACQQLLHEKGLFGEQGVWCELAHHYAGNPLALKMVAEMVQELFEGDIAAFLAQRGMSFHSIRHLLTQQFERLSSLEQTLMYWLAIEREAISLDALQTNLWPSISPGEVIEAMHLLRNRSLVERGGHGAVLSLQPVVLEYVTDRLIIRVSEEILDQKPMLLLTHALLKARAKDYLRTVQEQLILQPILDRLAPRFANAQGCEEHLKDLLRSCRARPRAIQGYGGGNLVNLLIRLQGHIHGLDCSQLTIWQANLQGAEAQEANFSGSDLMGSVFLETIGTISSVAVSADGQYIAAGDHNGEIRLWRMTDGQLLQAWVGHNGLVWSLAFHPEKSWLASGGYDGLVKVWEVSTGQLVRDLQGHTKWIRSVAFHPTGRLLATCSDDGSIRLWDLLANDRTSIWHQQESAIWSLAFSPDGKLLASGDMQGEIKLWDLESQRCLWSVTAPPRSGALSQRAILSVAFSPSGEVLVSGGQDATIRVWATNSGAHLNTLLGHTARVYSVAFDAEGLLASGSEDGSVKLWQVGPRGETAQNPGTLYGHTGILRSVVFGPHGLLVSGGQDGCIKIWQINREEKGGRCLKTLRGYSRLINTMAFSPDGRLLISSEQNGMVRMWETASGRCLRILSRHAGGSFALAFSPDGQLFASGFSSKLIQLWDVESGRCLRTLQGHQGPIWALAFSPEGRFLVSSGLDTMVKRWEIESGQCLSTLQGHHNWVWSVACSPDGKLLASGDFNGVVKVWEVESGRCLHTLQGSSQAIVALLFTPDSQTLLSSNAQDLVTMWDVQRGQCLKAIPGIGDTYWLRSVTLSADGNLLATRSRDQTIKIWDVKRGEMLRALRCPVGHPWSVALSADQRVLACGTDEGSIILWEMHTGEYLGTLRGDQPYERMNISGVTGITEAQKASLTCLGAIGKDAETEH